MYMKKNHCYNNTIKENSASSRLKHCGKMPERGRYSRMKMKRTIALLLAGLMGISMAACGAKGTDGQDAGGNKTGAAGGSETQNNAGDAAGNGAKDGGGDADGAGSGTEPVLLKIWGGVPPEAGPQESVDRFNEAYQDRGIQAEYVYYVNDDNGNLKLETTLMAGEGVDAYMCYDERYLSKRIEGGMALDLTDLCERDGFDIKELFGEEMVTSYEYDGVFYCIPTKRDQYGMMLNKDMFDEAGIPIPTEWTYSEFREIAKQLTHGEGEQKVYGAFLNTQQNLLTTFQYFGVASLGGDWMYNEDGTATNFTDPVMVESAQLAYDMMNVDGSAPTHVDSVTQKLSCDGMFMNERTAMVPASWTVRNVKNLESYPHDFVTAFAPYPVPDNAEAPYIMGGVGDMLCINPKSPNVDACWEYVKWYSTEGIVPLAYGGRIPLCKSIDMDEVNEYFFRDAEGLLDEESAKYVMIVPRGSYAFPTISPNAAELGDILSEEMEAVLNGKKTVEQGLADAKERGDALLAK